MGLCAGAVFMPSLFDLIKIWDKFAVLMNAAVCRYLLLIEKMMPGFGIARRCWAGGLRSLPPAVFIQNVFARKIYPACV